MILLFYKYCAYPRFVWKNNNIFLSMTNGHSTFFKDLNVSIIHVIIKVGVKVWIRGLV